jgi:hypothetical protein
MCLWSMSACNSGCGWLSSCSSCCGLGVTTLSNWAACVGIDNSSSVASWASFFRKMETLVLVAFARVLVAATFGIDWFTDKIFITFACWSYGLFAFWALFWWTSSTAWSSTASINIISSDLVGSFFTCSNITCLLRAFNNA